MEIQQIKDIVNKYLAGEDAETLATQFGVSKTSVWSYLRQLQVISKPKKGIITLGEDQLLDLAKEIENGKSIREAAKEKGIPYATLQSNLKKLNLDLSENKTIGRKEKLSVDQIAEICSKYKEGLSSIQLAEMYNVSKDTVLKCLKTNKIEINRSGREKNKNKKNASMFSFSELQSLHLQYKAGASIESLAKQYNVGQWYLRQQFKENNLSISNKKLSDIDKKDIKKRYKKGENIIDLAEIYNVSKTLISEILESKGVKKREERRSTKSLKANKSKITPEAIQNILKRHSEGVDLNLLAQEVALPVTTVSKIINRRIKTNLKDEQIEELCQKYLQGEKIGMLATIFHLSQNKIRIILKSRGIPTQHTRKLTPSQKLEINQLYSLGCSPTAIATTFNVSPTTIRKLVNKLT